MKYCAERNAFPFLPRLLAAGWMNASFLDKGNPLICTMLDPSSLPVPGMRWGVKGYVWARLIAPNENALRDPDGYLGRWEYMNGIEYS